MVDVLPKSRPTKNPDLIDVVEPLFLQVCRLNRIARSKGNLTFEEARAETVRLFEQMREAASVDPALAQQFEKVEMPLVFFLDSMIADSTLSFRERWDQKRLAEERGELAGDEKFFDLLDKCLADATEESTERLVVFYTCLGLGFTGMYINDPLQIESRMQRVAHRIRRRWLNRDFEKRLCAQAYEHTDTSILPVPARDSVGRIVAWCSLVLVVLFIVYSVWFMNTSGELTRKVDDIIKVGATAAADTHSK